MVPEETAALQQEPQAAQLGSPDDKRADLMARLRKRNLPSGQEALKGGELVKRRKVTFDLDGVDCAPDVFMNEVGEYITFSVTLQSLNSAQEMEALRGVRDASQAPLAMAKLSLFALNGQPVLDAERDYWWECLGPGGRQICMMAFGSLGAASESSMGKYLSTRSEGF